MWMKPPRKRRLHSFCAAVLAAGLLAAATGCATSPLASREDTAAAIARDGGLTPVRFPTGRFELAGWVRPGEGNAPMAVYIEGDGFAFVTARQVSSDPTPRDPEALRLAARHPRGGPVLYLARPCQYQSDAALARCSPAYWTTYRYALETIAALNDAIDREKTRTGARQIELIGFSGGGVAAALVAARRDDVVMLTTLAANLDVAAWTGGERLTPLSGSLDPARAGAAMARVPQRHYVGARDDVVPPYVLQSYMRAIGNPPNATLTVLPGVDHDCCWLDRWPALLVR